MRKRNYNARAGESEAMNSYQITFRTNRKLSGQFASCKGLIKKCGKKMTMISLFEQVIMPAMREYVAPLAEQAKKERHKV